MKKLIGLVLSLILSTGLLACDSKNIKYKEGIYEGNAEGHIGPIKVQVETDQYEIKEIKILEQQETPVIAEIVYKKLPPIIIKANSPEVDVVGGATYTSNGFLKAIKNALDKAKVKIP